MAKEADFKARLFEEIIRDARQSQAEVIDKAYAYFWYETKPDEFLLGTALHLGFINFEDWLVFDYRIGGSEETFIGRYIREKDLKGEELALAGRLRDSMLSLYEVESVAKDKRVLLKDLLRGGECSLRDKTLVRGLNRGDIFAARILDLDGRQVMSGSVYPFSLDQKKAVLDYIGREYSRYKRNENPEGSMRDYLKKYGDIFNIVWMHLLVNQKPGTQGGKSRLQPSS